MSIRDRFRCWAVFVPVLLALIVAVALGLFLSRHTVAQRQPVNLSVKSAPSIST